MDAKYLLVDEGSDGHGIETHVHRVPDLNAGARLIIHHLSVISSNHPSPVATTPIPIDYDSQ